MGLFGNVLRSLLFKVWVIAASAVALSACGDSGNDAPTGTYNLSGSVSGLIADGLVLTDGSATMTLSTGATSFTSAKVFQSGQAYAVTVQTQPSSLICSIAN